MVVCVARKFCPNRNSPSGSAVAAARTSRSASCHYSHHRIAPHGPPGSLDRPEMPALIRAFRGVPTSAARRRAHREDVAPSAPVSLSAHCLDGHFPILWRAMGNQRLPCGMRPARESGSASLRMSNRPMPMRPISSSERRKTPLRSCSPLVQYGQVLGSVAQRPRIAAPAPCEACARSLGKKRSAAGSNAHLEQGRDRLTEPIDYRII